jgi:serine/threonine-protein kinase
MTDEPRVERLLDELLESQATPEEVCRSCPELLPEVRARWRQMCRVREQLDALFPTSPVPDAGPPVPPPGGTALPHIPGYEVEAVLGRGGMGVVFRARQLRLNRVVALKMTLADAYAGPRERERFQREAEAVAGLRHPNVVQVYDVGDAAGRPYFTMEYVEGGSLAQQLTGTPRPARQATALLATLAAAVQAAHQSGIVHRDLKPANVLLTADGTPKVTDFGVARRLDGAAGLTRTGAAVGTPSYMAPEQAGGDKNAVGPATDVHALGAILYELLTGRPPFGGETAAATVLQVIHQDPVPPSRRNARVPRDLETITLKCLQKDPQKRYASAAALAEDLRRFLRGEAIAARPEGRLGRLARRVRRRPALSAAVALAALLAVALVGGGLWLASERAAAARAAQAEWAATERAAAEDLREMVRWLKKSSWHRARAALERAKGRLGERESAELRPLLDQGARDLDLAARLDALRLHSADTVGGYLDAGKEYEEAFREAGLGQVGVPPEGVATRIAASNIQKALVAALDHWSIRATDPGRRAWVLEVARQADPGATGWRARARDPGLRKDGAGFARLVATAPVDEESVSLLLALEQQLQSGPHRAEQVPFLKRVQKAHPGDFWVNARLGIVLYHLVKFEEAIGYFRAALAVRPSAALIRHYLGCALQGVGRNEEAVEQHRKAVQLDPTDPDVRSGLGLVLSKLGRQDEAIEQIRAGLRDHPNSANLYYAYGICLEAKGQPVEALARQRRAIALDPKHSDAQREVRSILLRQGRADEARAAWQTDLRANPPEHDAWYGYAELCLYLGKEDEYRRARRALLRRFGTTTDPQIAERTARACLLRSACGSELRQAVALAERAAAADREKYQGLYPCFRFAQGLAEYRQGRFDRAIPAMRGDASRVLGPAPRLVLAMALHRSGRVAEAREALAAAVAAHDWRASQVRDQDGWIVHVLRREAEGMILPNLPAFLDAATAP